MCRKSKFDLPKFNVGSTNQRLNETGGGEGCEFIFLLSVIETVLSSNFYSSIT